MHRGRGVAVLLKGYDEATAPGELRIQEWNKRERTLRAMKFGGACLGLAIVSVILPLLHFVLVPGFLLAGPIVAFVVLGQEAVVLGGKGICPYCKKTMTIVRNAPRFPISDMCEHCQKSVKIELA
jgi:hypothetical protein